MKLLLGRELRDIQEVVEASCDRRAGHYLAQRISIAVQRAMSTAAGGQTIQQLQQDLQNELTTANQLLMLISRELQQIKHLTRKNGEFEENVKQNASLLTTLGNMQQVDMEKLPPMVRKHIDMSNNSNHNISYEQHETFRNNSGMDDS